MRGARRFRRAFVRLGEAALLAVSTACGAGIDAQTPADGGALPGLDEPVRQRLAALSPAELPPPPPDPTNAYLADPRAAALGKQLFFDTRFSGPLLDAANNGDPATLGLKGETGKVGCVSCHVPSSGFSDTRSTRAQISLGSGWTHRRAKSLLDVAQSRLLNWDAPRLRLQSDLHAARRPAEFNSSRLFVAQQLARLYRNDYEAIFGPLPALDRYAPVLAADAGCPELPT